MRIRTRCFVHLSVHTGWEFYPCGALTFNFYFQWKNFLDFLMFFIITCGIMKGQVLTHHKRKEVYYARYNDNTPFPCLHPHSCIEIFDTTQMVFMRVIHKSGHTIVPPTEHNGRLTRLVPWPYRLSTTTATVVDR